MPTTTQSKRSDFFELTKPRVTFMVLITTLFGYYLGSQGTMDWILLFNLLIGTALVAGGTSALNQYLERDIDAKMMRTKNRPLPTGRLNPEAALAFAIILSILGITYLVIAINLLTAALAALTLASYIFVYTPLKQKHSLSTVVGAIPGALPPMGGWAAARGELGIEAWILFAILFLWQLPHFLAIAWIYRQDYAKGGFPLLTVVDPEGHSTARQIVSNCLALLPVSLLPTLVGIAGITYFFVALTLSLIFLCFGLGVIVNRSNVSARYLARASLVYLPVLLIVMAFDKTIF